VSLTSAPWGRADVQKVLIADASAPMRRALELALVEQGIQVVTASDGAHAIAMLATERPDALVVELALPGRSGVEVSASVRQRAELRDVPVVLLIGAFETVDTARVAGAGIDDVWTKPVDFRRMAPRLRELAARRTAADTDTYLERLSAALEELDRRPAAPSPPVVARGDEERDRSLPTLASILGETPAPTEVEEDRIE
jgi:DNA-binding response OmpR family regulator